MKRNSALALSLAAAFAITGAVASPAFAGSHHNAKPGQSQGGGQGAMMGGGQGGGMMGGGQGGGMMGGGQGGMMPMMQMMMQMHKQMAGGQGGGMMGGAMMGGQGGMMGGVGYLKGMDTDGDGKVSPQELRAGLEARLKEFDADGNGSLSIDEFEAMHSAAIREMMVDRFQALDNDGDGQVTGDEITAPAKRLEQKMKRRAARMAPKGGATQQPGMMGNTDADDNSGSDNN